VGKAVMEERIDKKTGIAITLEPGDPRFPILNPNPIAQSGKGGDLLHVGGIGDVVDAKGALIIKSEKRNEMQRQLDYLANATKRTEILFVIDNTASMQVCAEIPAKMCLEIAKSVKEAATTRGQKHEVFIALAYFRDSDARFDKEKLIDGKSPFVGEKLELYADGVVLVRPMRDVSKKGDELLPNWSTWRESVRVAATRRKWSSRDLSKALISADSRVRGKRWSSSLAIAAISPMMRTGARAIKIIPNTSRNTM